jgi:heme oxygenase
VSVRSALRAETADDHRRVDTIFGAFHLGEPTGYRGFMAATAAAYLPVEEALDAGGAAEILPGWTERRRAHLLRDDLAALRIESAAPLPAPAFPNEAALLGGIYVLEGSRLGGALLKRGIPSGSPRRFLDSPAQPGAWRKLGEILDARLRASQQQTDAIVAAKQVFGLFAQAGIALLEPTT